jgi:predicted nucleotidyltransferase
VKIFWLNLDEVRDRLTKAAQQLAEIHPEIHEVWLFGSLARRQAVPGSDADVLLVLEECNLPFLERSAHYQPEFCGVGVDLFAYTRKELEQMEEAGHLFLNRIKTERICLLKRRQTRRKPEAQSS